MNKAKISHILCAAAALVFFGVSGISCSSGTVGRVSGQSQQTQATLSADTVTTQEETTASPQPDKTVHLVAAGDNLIHKAVYREAQKYSDDGTYNFLPLYENVADIVQSGDISILNQESLICNGDFEISGSNMNFNSPTELGDDMIKLGFNVFTIANNHVLDKGTEGLESTLDYWDEKCRENPDIRVLGAYRDSADAENIRVIEKNGIKFAFLAYTEHLNGYSIPSDSPLRVILTSETDVIKSQIEKARTLADVVVVSAHWGVEDVHTVSDDRRSLARDMTEWGADLIIGTHTHTAETMEFITRSDGTRGFVYYSLGNFISAQTDNFNMVGEIADLDIVMDGDTGEISLENVGAIPVINHFEDGSFTNMHLYPYSMYSAELASRHGLPYTPVGTAKNFSMDIVDSIIEENIPEEFRKLD